MVTDRRVVERGSAPLLKIMRMLGGHSPEKGGYRKGTPLSIEEECYISMLAFSFV